MTNRKLLEALDGARLVKYDRNTGILHVWHEGTTANRYTAGCTVSRLDSLNQFMKISRSIAKPGEKE